MISSSDTHPHPSIPIVCLFFRTRISLFLILHSLHPHLSPIPPPLPFNALPASFYIFLPPGSLCIYNTLLHPLGSSVSLSMQPTPTVFCAILCFIYLRTLYQPPPAILYSSRSLTFYAPPFVASYFIPPLALFSSAHFCFLSHTFFFSLPFRRGRTRWME